MTSRFDSIFAETCASPMQAAFGECVIQHPMGDLDISIEVDATVIADSQPGTNEVEGEGVTPDSRRGERFITVLHLIVRDTPKESVPDPLVLNYRDQWTIYGQRWQTRRADVVARGGFRNVIVYNVDRKHTRKL